MYSGKERYRRWMRETRGVTGKNEEIKRHIEGKWMTEREKNGAREDKFFC